jgi:hypothetical protein
VLFNMMHSVYNIKMTQVLIAMALYVWQAVMCEGNYLRTARY